jgi:hypothetical protein
MRAHVLFFILWVLLVLFPAGDMLYSFGQYRVGKGLEAILSGPPYPKTDADRKARDSQMQAVTSRTDGYLTDIAQDGFEILLLAGVLFCFIRVWRRKSPQDVYAFSSKSKDAA